MFNYYTVYSRYFAAPLLQKSEKMPHESTVWVIYGHILWVHSMTRTSSLIPVCFDRYRYIDHDLSSAYNIYISSEINVSYKCYMMPACMIYIHIYVYIYIYIYTGISAWWNFCETLFYHFSWNKSGVVMGPALSSLVAPQVVITKQIWGIWKLRQAYSPETPNLGQNRWCFVPCDLEIWWMTLENNRASLLCCFKLCATFHSHRWIQTGVTVRKRPIWVKFDDF